MYGCMYAEAVLHVCMYEMNVRMYVCVSVEMDVYVCMYVYNSLFVMTITRSDKRETSTQQARQ
jgi:hypothetical protein